MRVLVVMPGVGPEGGAEQSLAVLAPELIDRGADLHLAVLTAYQTLVPELESAGVVIHDLSAAPSAIARAVALRRLVRRVRPELVHATLWDATLPTQLAMVANGPPLLITWAVTPAVHTAGQEAPALRRKQQLLLLADTALGRLSSARYHAVTRGVGCTVGSAMRVRRDRVLVGERGRPDPGSGVAPDRVEVLDRLGIAPGDRMVLAVGRQDPQKGYSTLLDHFDRLAGEHDEVHLVIAGRPGSATPALQRQRASLRHADRMHFVGHRADVADLLAVADVVVCSSWREGAAGALIEAMACARPIVSVRLDGLDGVLEHGHDALVVERSELAAAVVELLDDPDLAQRLGGAGRRTYEERFTVGRSADRMLEIYRTVSRSTGRGDRSQVRSPSARTMPGT